MTMPEVTDDTMVAAIHSAAAGLQLQVVPEQASPDTLACLPKV